MNNLDLYETSAQDGIPIECYKFSYNDMQYLYTSSAEDLELVFNENGLNRTEKYYADYITRRAIQPGATNSLPSFEVTVAKDHPVAKLFQGPPPESKVALVIYRLHEPDKGTLDAIIRARIGQASFSGSDCTLTCNQENWLQKELPHGTNQYYCNHTVFDHNCRLNRAKWQVEAFIDKVDGLHVYSAAFANYEDGYLIGGRIYFDGYVRMIAEHQGNRIKIKYPFVNLPRGTVIVLPGCDARFRTCVQKFHNAVNFLGAPYVAPTDPEKNPAGKGAYWIDSLVVERDTDGFVGTIDL